MDLNQLCGVLQDILAADNERLEAGTIALQQLTKESPTDLVQDLTLILSAGHVSDDIRQTAGVLLRKRILAKWHRHDPQLKAGLKESLLALVSTETPSLVLRTTLSIISSLAKIEIPDESWPELLTYLYQTIHADEAAIQLVGLELLSNVLDEPQAADKLQPQFPQLLEALAVRLQSDHPEVVAKVIIALSAIVGYISSDHVPLVKALLPTALMRLRQILDLGLDNAAECLELLESCTDSEIPFSKPFIPSMIELACHVAKDLDTFEESVSLKGLTFIHSMIICKSKTLAKKRMLPHIFETLFAVLDASSVDFEPDLASGELAEERLYTYCLEMLTCLSNHVPAEIVIPGIVPFVTSHATADLPGHRRAAFDAVTAVVDGCSYYIRTSSNLQALIELVLVGMGDITRLVRAAACITLSEMAQDCQPEISLYHETVLPRIIASVKDPNDEVQGRACFALEKFLDVIEEEVLPYLPEIVGLLNTLATMGPDAHQIAISCLGALALAGKEAFEPYAGDVMAHLATIMDVRDEEQIPLICQAIDTAGVLTTCMPGNMTMETADAFMTKVLAVVQEYQDDPDLKVASYTLFGNFAKLLGADFARYFETIMPMVLGSTSASSVHRIVLPSTGDANALRFQGDDDVEDEDDEDGFSGAVHTSELPEGEAAMQLIAGLAQFTRLSYAPYLLESANACRRCMSDKLQWALPSMRVAVLQALTQLTLCYMAASNQSTDFSDQLWQPGLPLSYAVEEQTAMAVQFTSSALLSQLSHEVDISAVTFMLECVQQLLLGVGPAAIAEPNTQTTLLTLLDNLLNSRSPCQTAALEDGDFDDEDGQESYAERELLLLEYTGEVLVALCKVLGPTGADTFMTLFPTLERYATRRGATGPERNFSVGTMVEAIEGLQHGISGACQAAITTVLASRLHDEDAEIRGNALYGCGLVFQYGDVPPMDDALGQLLNVIKFYVEQTEFDSVEAIHAHDNACSCAGRIFRRLALVEQGVPAPVLELATAILRSSLQCLPLEQDVGENQVLLEVMAAVLDHPLREQLDACVPIATRSALTLMLGGLQDTPKGAVQACIQLCQAVHIHAPAELQAIMANLEPAAAAEARLAIGL